MDERYCEKHGIGPGGDWCPEKLQVCVNLDVLVDIPIEMGNLAQNIESEATAFIKESLVESLVTGPRGEGFPLPAVRSMYIHSSDVTDDRFKRYYDPDWNGEPNPIQVRDMLDAAEEARRVNNQNESEASDE